MKDVLLSDLYWKLHRNSTISSFLLFLSANKLIHVANLLGATVEKNDNLVSFFLFIWASYAVAVFFFEGSREEARKSIEVREEKRRQLENFEKIYQEIKTSLTYIRGHLESNVGRMKSNIDSLERNRDSVSPVSTDIRFKCSLDSKDDELHIAQICSQSEDRRAALTKIKQTIADAMYGKMSIILQHSQSDLQESVNGITKTVDNLVEQLHKAEGLLNTKNRQLALGLSIDKMRVFLTGRSIPLVFYGFALIHFIGLYCTLAPSALDVLKLMKVY